MQVLLNGSPHETSTSTLADLLVELGLGDAVVATAVNGQFVSQAARAEIPLQAGDALEVLAPMQGG